MSNEVRSCCLCNKPILWDNECDPTSICGIQTHKTHTRCMSILKTNPPDFSLQYGNFISSFPNSRGCVACAATGGNKLHPLISAVQSIFTNHISNNLSTVPISPAIKPEPLLKVKIAPHLSEMEAFEEVLTKNEDYVLLSGSPSSDRLFFNSSEKLNNPDYILTVLKKDKIFQYKLYLSNDNKYIKNTNGHWFIDVSNKRTEDYPQLIINNLNNLYSNTPTSTSRTKLDTPQDFPLLPKLSDIGVRYFLEKKMKTPEELEKHLPSLLSQFNPQDLILFFLNSDQISLAKLVLEKSKRSPLEIFAYITQSQFIKENVLQYFFQITENTILGKLNEYLLDGHTLLTLAAVNGNQRLVEFLIEKGANKDIVSLNLAYNKKTPFQIAIDKKFTTIARIIDPHFGVKEEQKTRPLTSGWKTLFTQCEHLNPTSQDLRNILNKLKIAAQTGDLWQVFDTPTEKTTKDNLVNHYRQLSLKIHPDKNRDESSTANLITKVVGQIKEELEQK